MRSDDATRTHNPNTRWAELAEQVARATDPLVELRADQVARWDANDPVGAEEYLTRFPNLPVEDALALVVAEMA